MPDLPESVFLNGTVGAGKSATADALAELLAADGVPHAVIDLDQVRRSWPRPAADPFHHELELTNLAALAVNYRAAGAVRFILAGVIEERSEIARYEAALGGGLMFVGRLRASAAVLESRLRGRHTDDPEALAWHLRRSGELDGILNRAALDDAVFDSSEVTAVELARRIKAAAGW